MELRLNTHLFFKSVLPIPQQADAAVVRIGPIRFQAGCRTRQPNLAMLIYASRTLYCVVY